MKKNILSLSALFVAVAIIFSSCGKDDVGAPTISITGANPLVLDLGDTFTDPGAIANDEEDGNITSKMTITGTVNTDKVDEYSIVYKVTDKAGNEGSATRKVQVKSSKLAGKEYTATPSDGQDTYNPYKCTPIQSGASFNTVFIKNFGGYGATLEFTATVNPNNVTVSDKEFEATYDGQLYYVKIYNITGVYNKVSNDYRFVSFEYTEDIKTTPTGAPQTTTYTETWTIQ
ncbi:MAG: DUF5011 domain-containing protein [Bacteroidales bacterium]|nr:DUF5011 domain-containing protein [Bacteroidales bacterium]